MSYPEGLLFKQPGFNTAATCGGNFYLFFYKKLGDKND